MQALRRVVAVTAGLIGMAVAAPIAALPAVQVTGPSSVFVGETLELGVGISGDAYPQLAGLTVTIQGPAGVFDSIFGPLSAGLALNSVIPSDWVVDPFSAGHEATIAVFSPTFDVTDLPDGGGPLLSLSLAVVGATPDPMQLLFIVDFNDDRVRTEHTVAINANAVPEPGSLALALAAFAFIALSRRRR